MVLPHQEILQLCNIAATDPDDKETDTGPIILCSKKNVRSAGYDLRLGLEYYLPDQKEGGAGAIAVQTLDPKAATTISIPANRVVIVSIHEKLNLPNNIVGHLSLKLDLLLKGLIMSSQSQIDAGYKGSIFALLYNLSDRPVEISHLDSILRLELETLLSDTDAPYQGSYKEVPLAKSLRSPIGSSLYALRQDIDSIEGNARTTVESIRNETRLAVESVQRNASNTVETLKSNNRDTVESVRSDTKKVQLWSAILAAALVAAFTVTTTVVTSYFTYFGPLPNRITKLEQSTNVEGLSKDLQNLTKTLEKEPDEKKALLDTIEKLNKRLDILESKKTTSRRRHP
jgi:deoxycytidine triphosphate deaminase